MTDVDVAHDVRVMFTSSADATVRAKTIAFRFDRTKRSKLVRATTTGTTGHMTRLTRVEDGDGRVSRACDTCLIEIHGVRFTRSIEPRLTKIVDAREVAQRQLGTLAERGAAVQLRFGNARDDDGRGTCEVLDGALTIDPLHPAMEACASAMCEVVAEGARSLGTRAASVGKNPEVWTPRKLEEGDEGYEKGKTKYEFAWSGEGKFAEEFGRYRGLQSEAEPLVRKIAERDRRVAALHLRIAHLEEIRRGLEVGSCGVIPEDCFTRRVVDADLIDRLHEGLTLTSQVTGESYNVRECGVYFDDLEDCEAEDLKSKITETQGQLALAQAVLRAMHEELQERVRWDSHESGVETRDVLENGVRREHMERLLGRGATKADVEASLKLPDRIRAKLVGGYDVDRCRKTGKYIAATADRGPARLE